jgi:uncharacterized protein
MKASKYNLLVHEDNGKDCLLHNTMYGATIRFGRDLLPQVDGLLDQPNDFASPKDISETLIREKFLIDDSVDELHVLQERRRRGIEDLNRYDVVIMQTQDCNFRCRYCYETHKGSLMDEITAGAVLRWLEFIIAEVKVLYLSFFGGEPLLAKKSMLALSEQVYQLCKKSNTVLLGNVTTNGYLLDPNTAHQLIAHGFDNFQITIDGSPEYHDTFRPLKNGKGSFKRVFQNTLNLLDELGNKSITLRTNFNAENISSILQLYTMIPAQYRSRIRVSLEPIFRSGKLSADYGLTDTEIGDNISSIYSEAESMGFQVPNGTSGLGKLTYCFAERKQQAVVNYNGDVFKCSTCDFESRNRVGFINGEGRLIKEKKFSDWTAQEDFPQVCQQCKVLPLCMGGCRLQRLSKGKPESSCGLVPTNASLILKWIAYNRLENSLERQCAKLSACKP